MSTPDPSLSSYYVSNDFYAALVGDFTDWRTPDREITDVGMRDSARRILEREARYLDEDRLRDWLGMFAPECIYWIPGTRDGDPRREIAIAFDDRRRMEDRVYRLETGEAWSQLPGSRTTRLVSNVELFSGRADGIVMARANFLTVEIRAGEFRNWAGWAGYKLEQTGEGWEILVKQVNLIDFDQNLRNPSIIL